MKKIKRFFINLICLFIFSGKKRKEFRKKIKGQQPKKMILGVAYNLFDGEELLEASIKSIRSEVDFVCVVFQNVSNYGNKSDVDLKLFLENLQKKKLVDKICEYVPNLSKSGYDNEVEKRNIGLDICLRNGCSHFMSMDTDEFYRKEELKKAKKYVLEHDVECSIVGLYVYIKSPCYRIIEASDGFVPLIVKIRKNIKQGFNSNFPFPVDRSRMVNNVSRYHLFPKTEIMMHHMSGIRKNLHKKYLNSTFNDSESTKYQQRLRRIYEIENFELGNLYEGMEVKFVENEFDIKL